MMKREAAIDATGCYRYSLGREWENDAARVVFIMLNPSFADAVNDDPTIRRCLGFAKDWGYGSLEVVNLFAYRTSDPKLLSRVGEPVGLDCDRYIKMAVEKADLIVVAWGHRGSLRDRDRIVLDLLSGYPLYCLGMTKNDRPRHPLYLKRHLKPQQYLP